MITQLAAAVAVLGFATFAHALELKPYSAQALAAAQKRGQPAAVHFHADWCPTCRAQDKVLQTLKSEPGLEITVFKADYDLEKDLKRRFKVTAQSTLVVLKGERVVARVIGDTTAEGWRAALQSAL